MFTKSVCNDNGLLHNFEMKQIGLYLTFQIVPADGHCAKKPVTTMLTYPWKCTVLHCNHLGNTWKHYHPR